MERSGNISQNCPSLSTLSICNGNIGAEHTAFSSSLMVDVARSSIYHDMYDIQPSAAATSTQIPSGPLLLLLLLLRCTAAADAEIRACSARRFSHRTTPLDIMAG